MLEKSTLCDFCGFRSVVDRDRVKWMFVVMNVMIVRMFDKRI